MKRRKMLKTANLLIAGALSMIGFQSCDKGDEPDMYGPLPSEYQNNEENGQAEAIEVDGIREGSDIAE